MQCVAGPVHQETGLRICAAFLGGRIEYFRKGTDAFIIQETSNTATLINTKLHNFFFSSFSFFSYEIVPQINCKNRDHWYEIVPESGTYVCAKNILVRNHT